MTCTPDDVLTALELVALRVPDRHVSPDLAMAVTWHEEVGRFDREVVFAAARAWAAFTFPSAGEFFESCQAEARALTAERAAARRELAVAVGDHECENGWVMVDQLGHGAYRPCPSCRPVEHAVWVHRTDPAHPERCGECAKIRKGTKKDRPGWLVEAYEREAASGFEPEPAF